MSKAKATLFAVLGGLWWLGVFLWRASEAGAHAAGLAENRGVLVTRLVFLATSIWGPLLLIAVGIAAYVREVVADRVAPSVADWHALEDRFARMTREVEGILVVDDLTGEPEWSIYPESTTAGSSNYGDGDRELDRFRAEATVGGLYVQKLRRKIRPRYRVAKDADAEDHWLSAIAETLHSGSGITGSGINQGRTHTTTHVARLVQASKTQCARFAALSRS